MSRMTRTQISLEESQYRYLRREALARSTSISALIREMLRERMLKQEAAGVDILSVAGMFSDGTMAGLDHDQVLYEDLVERKLRRRP